MKHFVCMNRADVFHPYEKHHSTAKDAALLAEQLGVKHLLLYHTEDKNLARAQGTLYRGGAAQFQGEIHVPEDWRARAVISV